MVFVRIDRLSLGSIDCQDCSIRLQKYTIDDIRSVSDDKCTILSRVLQTVSIQLSNDRTGYHDCRIPFSLCYPVTYNHENLAQEATIYASKSSQEETLRKWSAFL